MAVKAACLVRFIGPEGANIEVVVSIAGLDPNNPVNIDHSLHNVSPAILSTVLEQNIKDAVKQKLISDHGYTFGLLDSIRLINALL